jgi:hypothetical protein
MIRRYLLRRKLRRLLRRQVYLMSSAGLGRDPVIQWAGYMIAREIEETKERLENV